LALSHEFGAAARATEIPARLDAMAALPESGEAQKSFVDTDEDVHRGAAG
jgi:hypothetical protein